MIPSRTRRVHVTTVVVVLGVGILLLAPISFWLAIAELLSRVFGVDWTPGVEENPPVLGVDKLIHFALFFVLSWQVARSWRHAGNHSERLPLWFPLVACGAYGVLLEVLQGMTGRTADLFDAAADVLGVLGFVGWSHITSRSERAS